MQQATALAPIKKSPKPQPELISLATPADVRYWMDSLGLGEEQLRLLVRMHGTDARPIRAALSAKNTNKAA